MIIAILPEKILKDMKFLIKKKNLKNVKKIFPEIIVPLIIFLSLFRASGEYNKSLDSEVCDGKSQARSGDTKCKRFLKLTISPSSNIL